MTFLRSPKLAAYVTLGVAGLLASLVVRRPEPAVLGLPFLLAGLVALVLAERPALDVTWRVDRNRVVEGDEIRLSADVRSPVDIPWLQVRWPLPATVSPAGGAAARGAAVPAGAPQTIELVATANRWGAIELPPPLLRAHDAFGFFRSEIVAPGSHIVRVYPRPERLRRAVRPAETQAFSGNELARVRGDGIEFADVRQYVPGDRPRRINWRLSSRLGQLHVNEAHPERNTDVVLFLDTFMDLRAGDRGTMDATVRGAGTLADHYLRRRDRVAVVGFGGVLSWLLPGMGDTQAYRIADALIDSEVFLSHVWRSADVIPPKTLPPRSLVLAITPLLDERVIEALLDLRARGYDLAVLELDAEPYVAARPSEFGGLAIRLWRLHRAAVRLRYRELGVPIVPWRMGDPLQRPASEAEAFRRRTRWLSA